ncbi:MAG: alpha/beta hydrolase [Vicinamibacteria bacterium]
MDGANETQVLILPGLFDSGPLHWQTLWGKANTGFARVEQEDWATPRCADWVATLEAAVAGVPGSVLVAHSSACALIAHWASTHDPAGRVKGALLVAPSDPEGSAYPEGPTGFAPMPQRALHFPSIVVFSTDDVYVSVERAEQFADAWGSEAVNIGAAGHINSQSGLGDWPAGFALLHRLRNGSSQALG